MNRLSVYPILLVNFIGTLGFSIVIPFLIFLVSKFGGNSQIYGLLGATYPAFQLLGAPILGRWSDIYGRRKILLLSQCGTLLSWLIFLTALFLPVMVLKDIHSDMFGTFALTVPLLILFFARALDGLTGGNISVAHAYLVDITLEKDRNKNFGKMAVSANLGFIIGPALAGFLGTTVLQEILPILVAIFISVVAVLLITFYLPESKPVHIKENPEQLNVRKIFGQEQTECIDYDDSGKIKLKQVLKLNYLPYIILLYFLVYLGFSIFYTAFPIHAAQGLSWSVKELGVFFAFLSFMMILVQGPVLNFLSKHVSEAILVISGNLILGTNFVLLTFHETVIVYLAAVFFAVGNGLMWPSLLSILSKVAGEKYQGSVQGFASSFGSLASIIGLILGGLLYGLLGSAAFLLSAGIIYVIFLLSFRLLLFHGLRNQTK